MFPHNLKFSVVKKTSNTRSIMNKIIVTLGLNCKRNMKKEDEPTKRNMWPVRLAYQSPISSSFSLGTNQSPATKLVLLFPQNKSVSSTSHQPDK
jgi:hypothetical protein